MADLVPSSFPAPGNAARPALCGQNQGDTIRTSSQQISNRLDPLLPPTLMRGPMHQILQSLVVLGLSLVLSGSGLAQTIAFDPETNYPTGHVPEPLVLGDLNGDGKPDVVFANTAADGEPGGNSISVLLGNGDGTFTESGDFPVNGTRPEGLALALINEDSFLDVVTNNFESNNLSVLLGKGDGTFEEPGIVSVPGGPRFVVAGDFDGDGVMDLATSNYNTSSVSILKGYANGSFTISTTIPVGEAPEMLAVAHLNADSILDLVTCNRLDDNITPLQGNGDGSFTRGEPYEVGDEPRFLITTDMNGDGLDEVIVANNSSHTLTVEKNEGSLTFSRANTLSFVNPSVLMREPVYVAKADMNGDGADDILATWADSNVFTIFPRAEGVFDFGDPTVVRTGTTPLGIAAADFNVDGALDVVVANALDDTASVYLSYAANPGVIVDNGAAGTQATGPWSRSDTPFFLGKDALFSKDGTRYAWTANVPEPAQYEVMLWWTVTPGHSQSVPVEVRHADGTTSLFVDQTKDIGVWHSLGAYQVDASCTVTITSPQGGKSVSADAVRLRKLASAPAVLRGGVSVASLERPKGYKIDKSRTLAFQGRVAVDSNAEGEDIVAALFAPIGPGNESAKIAQLKLYSDSNGNGVYDSGDRQLGDPRSFASDIRTVVFDGFRETIADDSFVDLFVIAELAPSAVATSARNDCAIRALAIGAAIAGVLLLRRTRDGLVRITAAALLIGGAFFLPLSGCKGGGGGGGSQNLQLQLTSIVAEGQSTSTPSVNTGLPVAGWRF